MDDVAMKRVIGDAVCVGSMRSALAEEAAPDEDGAAVAVAEPPVEAEQEQQRGRAAASPKTGKPKPKQQPPYRVVLLNDDDHTFVYVIGMLMKVFRLTPQRAFELTTRVDAEGRAAVWTGSKEVAELKRDQVRGFGPDFYASRTVRYPLGCVIEPAE